jgi:hypothetical protein
MLRLSAYRRILERMRAGETIYAASKSYEVDEIKDIRDRAAKVARELIGDYGNTSLAGQWMSRHTHPFWRWVEINLPRYFRLFQNATADDAMSGGGRGRAAATAGMGAARTLGKFALRANVLFLMVTLYNRLVWPEEEEALGDARRQLHIILGKRPDGTTISLRFEGALADALKWVNLQDWPHDLMDVIREPNRAAEKLSEAVREPANQLIQRWEPFGKTMFEVGLGRQAWPSIWSEGTAWDLRSRPVRDPAEHVFRTVSADWLWNYVTGKPVRERNVMARVLGKLLVYQTDPGEAAYWQIRQLAIEWKKKEGKGSPGGGDPTDRGNALYYYRRAVGWGDDRAATRWYNRYIELGGTPKGLNQSLERAAPLGSVADRDIDAFLGSLDEHELEILTKAEQWWGRVTVPTAR